MAEETEQKPEVTQEDKKSAKSKVGDFVKTHPKKLIGTALLIASLFAPDEWKGVITVILNSLGN